jgi:cell division septation protein DedD
MARTGFIRLALTLGGALALTACDDAQMPSFMRGDGSGDATAPVASSRTVERDIEAPEVFQVTDQGLWDGRPSLGGVWVAHPDARDPERVIIRNEANGKFVIGVLYRPERQTPGPAFQASSEAAKELEMLAGQPARLNVTALRRAQVPVDGPADAPAGELAAAPAIAETPLDPIAAAAAALDAAEAQPAITPAAATPPVRPAAGGLGKPYVQIGIFSVQGNADNTAEALRRAGMVPTIIPGKMNGKDFWRVIVGPATTASDRNALLKKIKELGFNDAYFVTN